MLFYFLRKNERITFETRLFMGVRLSVIACRPGHAPGNRTPHLIKLSLLSLCFPKNICNEVATKKQRSLLTCFMTILLDGLNRMLSDFFISTFFVVCGSYTFTSTNSFSRSRNLYSIFIV